MGPEDGDQFAPSKASFMVNYRVEDLHAVVAALKAEGCNVLDRIDESEYGKFAWVIDPEGNKVEASSSWVSPSRWRRSRPLSASLSLTSTHAWSCSRR